jgi:hypothetical protein
MKRLLSLAAFVCVATVPFFGQNEPKLAIILKSEKKSYSLHSNIRLTFVRQNQGTRNLLVPRQWGWGLMRTDIHVFDAKGREIKTDFLLDELPPPPQPYDFVLLEPGEFLGLYKEAPATQFVSSPGDYEFLVEYTSYLSDEFAREAMKMPGFPFWSRERGTMSSNRIKLHITE